jgi:hypothetical protein
MKSISEELNRFMKKHPGKTFRFFVGETEIAQKDLPENILQVIQAEVNYGCPLNKLENNVWIRGNGDGTYDDDDTKTQYRAIDVFAYDSPDDDFDECIEGIELGFIRI